MLPPLGLPKLALALFTTGKTDKEELKGKYPRTGVAGAGGAGLSGGGGEHFPILFSD